MKALSAAKISKMDVLDYLAYTKQSNNAMDTESALEYAEEKGMAKGVQRIRIKTIESLLKQGILSVELIAEACEVPVAYVLQIKENLDKPKKALPAIVRRKKRMAKPKLKNSNTPQVG